MPAPPHRAPPLVAAPVAADAALPFAVEPLVSRLALPLLGGAPVVWGTCRVFFQSPRPHLVTFVDAFAARPLVPRAAALHAQAALAFCGAYTVRRAGSYHHLTHGTTLHGAQDTRAAWRTTPLTYSHRAGPRWFTDLRDCPPRSAVVPGDARLRLADAPPGRDDLVLLDAFSSDAIPLHLLTREALALYLSRLAPDRVLAVHVSDRHVDLRGWSPLPVPTGSPPWTDDWSDVLRAVRWR